MATPKKPKVTKEQLKRKLLESNASHIHRLHFASQSINCTLTFLTPQGRKWSVTKTFKDEDHKQNFINKLKRERGFTLDEVYNNPRIAPFWRDVEGNSLDGKAFNNVLTYNNRVFAR